MRRHVNRRGFAASQRRKLTWATTVQGTFTLSGATTGDPFDLLANYKADGGTTQGITIMRTHIQLAVQSASPAIVDGAFCGLLVGTKDDTATQLNAQLEYADWLLYRSCYAFGGSSGSTSSENVYEIDIRAKRKMQELDQVYWLVLQSLGAATTSVAYSARVLLALP